ncbi:MAG: argininosuccinate lyase [Ardenticatenia bacterium]|nr:argininosuccinate lyase [Ardenticatenia bacterium]
MKLWGGRYDVDVDELMERFNASLPFDYRLWEVDIEGSRAWAEGLHRAGLLTVEELEALLRGLDQVAEEWRTGRFEVQPSDEDIHTAVERRLHELVGDVAGKLHTGRSRNDQVVTDERLYLRESLDRLDGLLRALQEALVEQAERHLDLVMPGYTHLQQAQPIRYSHWVLSFFWMFQRDRERLADARRRINILPLGAGALAGHSLGVDRRFLATRLGFDGVSPNSLDAVGDRDVVLEVLAWAAIFGVHASRLAEDLILYASREFGFVRLDPRYTTGSSLMPQKANPDALELTRGKSGRLIGNLVTLLVVLKGVPSAYNKDLQEDKEPLFDTLDTLHMLVPVLTGVVRTLQPQPERMRTALDTATLATDLADYLVRRGMPFRQAHHVVGRAVAEAERRGLPLHQLPLDAFQAISPLFDADLYRVFDAERAVEARSSEGGTASAAVRAQIEAARHVLAEE